MRRLAQFALMTVVGMAALVALPATAAFAHAETQVGPYTVAIGFGTEPAYVGIPNSIEVIIHVTKTDKGIDTAANTLTSTVAFGSKSMPVTLEGNFDEDSGGSPGDYRGAFVPTEPGNYTFHVQGKIDTTPVDLKFTSSATTFAAVTDPSTIEFPTKIPTLTELSDKVDRSLPRVQQAAIAAARKDAAEAASSAKSSADSARTLGIVAIVVGVVAIALSAVAITRGRKKA